MRYIFKDFSVETINPKNCKTTRVSVYILLISSPCGLPALPLCTSYSLYNNWRHDCRDRDW